MHTNAFAPAVVVARARALIGQGVYSLAFGIMTGTQQSPQAERLLN